MKGFAGLIEFVSLLERKKIHYALEHHRADSIMVRFDMVGIRVEVDFFEDHIEYSSFTGHEDVFSDEGGLLRLIDDNWD
jgi:hypothetical protein